ncbi:MAG: hypothetical protein K2I66_03810 [Bacteroidales bacterium]|nr:hypothetical protein [Bacteroidales bacterium]
MKRYALLLILGFAFMGIHKANAQTQPYNIVVVEDFMGTWCVDCPQVTDTLAALEKDFPQMEVIAYHLSNLIPNPEVAFFYNMDSYIRSCYYDTIYSVPTNFLNGEKTSKKLKDLRQEIKAKLSEQTPYAMTLEAKHFPLREAYRDSFEIKVKVERTAPDPTRELRLQLSFTQSHFPFKWRSQTEVNHSNTFMYPDGHGTAVTLDANGKAEFNFAFSVSRRVTKWPASKGHLVAFLQDKDRTVLQAARADFSTGALTFDTADIKTPDFWGTPIELDGSGTVRFYDNTVGETSSWNWDFEGGAPDTSSSSHPVVYYAEPGDYEVRLTTVSEGTSRSFTRGEFVRVLDTKPRIGITPNPARPNQPVKLEVLSLADSCEWSLFGSSTMMSSEKEVEITYPREGSFNISLKTYYKSPVTGISYTHDTTAIGAVVISKSADNEAFSDNSIRIVKNGDNFEVQTDRAVELVEVYASSGRRLLSTRQKQFSLAGQASGIYIVSVKPVDGAVMIFKVLR